MGSRRVGHDFTFTFTFHSHALEKEMATHSSVLAWRIPGTGEPGGLPSVGVAQSRTRLKRLSSRCSITTREKPTQHNGLAESKIGKSKLKKKNFQLHTLPAQSYFIEKSPF